jgi:two-component system response regulator FlrC
MAIEQLLGHAWPGNVRELDNLMQRALILLEGDEIGADLLCFEEQPAADVPSITPSTATPVGRLPEDLRSVEEQLILDALHARGSRKRVAERLGISERTLRYKIARMREAGIAIPG